MIRSWNRAAYWWWIGAPVIMAIFFYAPFVMMRCVGGAGGAYPCWRLPVVGQLVFDLYAYLEFMGMTIAGFREGVHLGAAGWIIQFVHHIAPFLTLPELWLALRWMSGVATLWVLSWVIGAFVELPVSTRRLSAVALWLAVFLPLGFRPGAYSWFLPFGLIVFMACARCWKLFEMKDTVRAVAWGASALAFSVVYAWFFVFAALWLGVIALMWLTTGSKRRMIISWCVLASVASLSAFALQLFVPDRIQIAFQTFMRNGMAFTRMPMVTALAISAVLWLIVVVICAHVRRSPSAIRTLSVLFIMWAIILGGWFSNIATGVYIHNDHFRLHILLVSWISIIALWSTAWHEERAQVSRLERNVLAAIALGAVLAILRIVAGPYGFDGNHLNIIHLFVWIALIGAVSSILFQQMIAVLSRRVVIVGVIGLSAMIGLVPFATMMRDEAYRQDALRSREPMLTWVDQHLPDSEQVCSTPLTAELIASQVGRPSFFTQQQVYSKRSNAELLSRLRILSTAVRTSRPDIGPMWSSYFETIGIACSQFGTVQKIFGRFMSQESMNALIGCPRKDIERFHAQIAAFSEAFGSTDENLDALCPWIVVPLSEAQDWSLPPWYAERYRDDVVAIYRHEDAQLP